MITYDADTQTFRPFRYTQKVITKMPSATFSNTMWKYHDDATYWTDFANKWSWHTRLEETHATVLSEEQQLRLDAVNDDIDQFGEEPERWASAVSDYVQFGAVDDESQCPVISAYAKTEDARQGRLAQTRYGLNLNLADVRFAKETSGVDVGEGKIILTDRESQSQLTSAYMTLKDSIQDTVNWKGSNGWVALTLDDVVPLVTAANNHVQNAFTAEKQVADQIQAIGDTSSDEAFATSLEELQMFDVATAFANAWQTLMDGEPGTSSTE